LRITQLIHTLSGMGHEWWTQVATDRAAGLRERKKAETRGAISSAAARLALERGLENVRVADIAADVGVSPRTYNNYFSSIPEAICAAASDWALALADAVRARPPDEPLDQAIANALPSPEDDMGPSKPLVTMIIHTPALRGEFFKAVVARDAALAQVIAERTGTDPGDLYPQVLAAAVSGAARVATHRWMHDETADYAALLRATLSMVAPMARAMPSGSPGEPAASAQRKINRPGPATYTRLQETG
jgi:AcrR family transcriptional regulator